MLISIKEINKLQENEIIYNQNIIYEKKLYIFISNLTCGYD